MCGPSPETVHVCGRLVWSSVWKQRLIFCVRLRFEKIAEKAAQQQPGWVEMSLQKKQQQKKSSLMSRNPYKTKATRIVKINPHPKALKIDTVVKAYEKTQKFAYISQARFKLINWLSVSLFGLLDIFTEMIRVVFTAHDHKRAAVIRLEWVGNTPVTKTIRSMTFTSRSSYVHCLMKCRIHTMEFVLLEARFMWPSQQTKQKSVSNRDLRYTLRGYWRFIGVICMLTAPQSTL